MSIVSIMFSLLWVGLGLLFFETKDGFSPTGGVVEGQNEDAQSLTGDSCNLLSLILN